MMENLTKIEVLQIKEIVEKLNNLDCSLLGNKNDAWIMELMFGPGFHRYNLIQWILSKFGYDIETNSSTKNKIKKLKSVLSEWGICREENVIEGKAVIKEQIQFWSSLVDLIWTKSKYEISSDTSMADSDEGVVVSPEEFINKNVSCEFEKACSLVHKLAASGNVQHLFKTDLQLAPDVESEIKNISSSELEMPETPKSQSLKKVVKENNSRTVALNIYKELCKSNLLNEDNESNSEAELNRLEEEMGTVSTSLQTISQDAFKDLYEDLQPLVQKVQADDYVDVGAAFQNVKPLLEDFVKLNKSFPKLESASETFSQVNSELEDLLSQDTLSDEYSTKLFKLLKE